MIILAGIMGILGGAGLAAALIIVSIDRAGRRKP